MRPPLSGHHHWSKLKHPRKVGDPAGPAGAGGVTYEEIAYEGYGPGGVALIIECLTHNRNRAAAEVRSTLEKNGGHLAATGAVAWNFEKWGVIHVKPGPSEDQVTEAAIEGGAEDVLPAGADGFEVRTLPPDLQRVTSALEARGLALGGRQVVLIPKDTVKITDPHKARAVLRLMEVLGALEEVRDVHANYEIDEELAGRPG